MRWGYICDVNVVKQRVLLVSTSAADLIHYRRKKFGQIRAGGLRVANSKGRASGFSQSCCTNKSGVLFLSILMWLVVMRTKGQK